MAKNVELHMTVKLRGNAAKNLHKLRQELIDLDARRICKLLLKKYSYMGGCEASLSDDLLLEIVRKTIMLYRTRSTNA